MTKQEKKRLFSLMDTWEVSQPRYNDPLKEREYVIENIKQDIMWFIDWSDVSDE